MTEKHVLRCELCDFAKIVRTPDTQQELSDLVAGSRFCDDCGSDRVLCAAWLVS